MKIKFDLNDIVIVPAELSQITSRNEVDVKYSQGNLPLICAPMDSIIDNNNVHIFQQQGILTCSIRQQILSLNQPRYNFISISLDQLEYILRFKYVIKDLKVGQGILIDIANGHMQKLFDLIKEFKNHFPNISIMLGNIANPVTYQKYCEILTEIDFVRLSIGSGSACITSSNLGVYYPMGSLIDECYQISAQQQSPPKLVADGGFSNFDEIIKALNLGADYIMCGNIFAKSLEACGPTYWKGINISNIKDILFFYKYKIYRKYRGMSTKDVQKQLGKNELRTSEGIIFSTPVKYTLETWTKNFIDYFKSAMSYTNCISLHEFIGKRNFIHISENSIKRYKK